MESGHLQETLPIFHISPRTLQEMAASQCAFVCWRNVMIMRNIGLDEICSNEWLTKHSSFTCTDIAPFPVGVRCLINHKIRLIGKEIKKWWRNHDHSILALVLSPAVMLNCVVLNPAGDICYKRTAKNLLTANPPFSLKEQFEIACEYCFKEDIKRLWFLLENRDFYSVDGFQKSVYDVGAVDYWCSKMRGELLELYETANEEQERSPEWFVLSNYGRNMYSTNWALVEYFWHQLNREEQNSLVGDILLDQRFTKHLILKLDDLMLENLSGSDLKSVFEILARDELFYDYVLQVWSYVNVKNMIVENADSFYNTLTSLSEMAFQEPYFYGFHVSSLLKEMWLSASIDFKNLVFCNHLVDLFERSLERVDIRSFGCDVGFFIELWSGASYEVKQYIWQRWWRKFFLLAQVSDVLELMITCFNSADDILQFKKKSMLDYDELGGIFTEFIKWGYFDELTEYLKFCCSDEEDEKLVREARKKLALGNFDRITVCDSELIFYKFLQFFHDSVSSADLAEVLNWEFQDKEANLLSMCILYDKGELSIFTRALRCFEFPDQRVIELKRFFFERCQHVLMSGDFNSFFVQDWESFLLWCTSSTENQNRFRDSIAIDDLFENLLINMHKFFMDCRGTSVVKYRYSHKHVFNSIDRLLGWYFRDHQVANARLFKYDKLMGYDFSEAIRMLLSMENEGIRRLGLLWFFDNERRELRNFLVDFGNIIFSRAVLWNLILSLR